ncbi:unnamed protein product [Mytilus edulis]|uniref:Cytochrome P450 n=1 Tax=Mytilus edulis TaxID=6550 RepID=A0A8S3ULQ4_MYTED|nr:unnamed protein product [Mytilus edulis]
MLRPAVVASYGPLIEQVTDDFIDILKRKKTIDDLQMTLSNYTTESVAMLCFNRRLGSIASEEPAEIVKCVSEMFTLLQKSMIMPFKTFKYFKTPLYKQAEMVRLRIQNIVEKELKAQLDVLNELKKENQLDDYLQKDPNFMYSLLADSRMTLGKITSIVTTLINAGIDSTANSMLFALSDLAFHQEKQQKLYQEIQTVVGDSKHLTKEHLAQMSFLKACIKESQRLTFPIMTGPARYMEWDTVVGGYTIPRKTLVSPDMAAMVKDERFFPKAKEYIPERWLRNVNDDITKGQEFPFAFKPFGFGPRGCIGQRFAEMEMQIGITKIIQNFEISMPPGVSEIKTVHRTFTSPAQKENKRLKMTYFVLLTVLTVVIVPEVLTRSMPLLPHACLPCQSGACSGFDFINECMNPDGSCVGHMEEMFDPLCACIVMKSPLGDRANVVVLKEGNKSLKQTQPLFV